MRRRSYTHPMNLIQRSDPQQITLSSIQEQSHMILNSELMYLITSLIISSHLVVQVMLISQLNISQRAYIRITVRLEILYRKVYMGDICILTKSNLMWMKRRFCQNLLDAPFVTNCLKWRRAFLAIVLDTNILHLKALFQNCCEL